jgi:hypothetical protein
MARVLRPGARAVLVVGYESRVLGAPFHNADIVQSIASRCGAFGLRLRQERRFTNRFGEAIREDILNLERLQARTGLEAPTDVGRTVAREALAGAATVVPERNRRLLLDAVGKVDSTAGTPVLNSHRYSDYQTRQGVMMVSEGGDRP